MTRMLGSAGFAGTGCSPRCRRTHRPRPKHDVQAMRAREDRSWRRDWAADERDAEDERHVTEWLKLTWWGRRALAGETSG